MDLDGIKCYKPFVKRVVPVVNAKELALTYDVCELVKRLNLDHSRTSAIIVGFACGLLKIKRTYDLNIGKLSVDDKSPEYMTWKPRGFIGILESSGEGLTEKGFDRKRISKFEKPGMSCKMDRSGTCKSDEEFFAHAIVIFDTIEILIIDFLKIEWNKSACSVHYEEYFDIFPSTRVNFKHMSTIITELFTAIGRPRAMGKIKYFEDFLKLNLVVIKSGELDLEKEKNCKEEQVKKTVQAEIPVTFFISTKIATPKMDISIATTLVEPATVNRPSIDSGILSEAKSSNSEVEITQDCAKSTLSDDIQVKIDPSFEAYFNGLAAMTRKSKLDSHETVKIEDIVLTVDNSEQKEIIEDIFEIKPIGRPSIDIIIKEDHFEEIPIVKIKETKPLNVFERLYAARPPSKTLNKTKELTKEEKKRVDKIHVSSNNKASKEIKPLKDPTVSRNKRTIHSSGRFKNTPEFSQSFQANLVIRYFGHVTCITRSKSAEPRIGEKPRVKQEKDPT